jgi:hypothetical protein
MYKHIAQKKRLAACKNLYFIPFKLSPIFDTPALVILWILPGTTPPNFTAIVAYCASNARY